MIHRRSDKLIYFIIIGVLILIIIGIIIFHTVSMNNVTCPECAECNCEDDEEIIIPSEDDEDTLNISDATIKQYLTYVPFLDGILSNGEYYVDAYDGEAHTITNINRNILLYNAYSNTTKYSYPTLVSEFQVEVDDKTITADEVLFYTLSDINTSLAKEYNLTYSKVPSQIYIPGGYLTLTDDDRYQAAYISSYEDTLFKETFSYEYYFEGEDLVIIETALFYKEIEENKYNVYANTSDMHNGTDGMSSFTVEEDTTSISLADYINTDIKTSFKHTFKKNDTGYFWYSTEVYIES